MSSVTRPRPTHVTVSRPGHCPRLTIWGWGGRVLEGQTDGQGCGSQSWDLQVSLIQSSGPAASSGRIHFIALCPSPRPFYPTVTAGHRGAVPSGWRTEGQGGDVRVSFEKPRLGLRLFG